MRIRSVGSQLKGVNGRALLFNSDDSIVFETGEEGEERRARGRKSRIDGREKEIIDGIGSEWGRMR